ncbi:FHA domain-containing protein, partial [Candidatus Peregrinibacteria bacterium]|nr:FHA domain-containing protein [Candidatus Peregrinibacteria bacterium]
FELDEKSINEKIEKARAQRRNVETYLGAYVSVSENFKEPKVYESPYHRRMIEKSLDLEETDEVVASSLKTFVENANALNQTNGEFAYYARAKAAYGRGMQAETLVGTPTDLFEKGLERFDTLLVSVERGKELLTSERDRLIEMRDQPITAEEEALYAKYPEMRALRTKMINEKLHAINAVLNSEDGPYSEAMRKKLQNQRDALAQQSEDYEWGVTKEILSGAVMIAVATATAMVGGAAASWAAGAMLASESSLVAAGGYLAVSTGSALGSTFGSIFGMYASDALNLSNYGSRGAISKAWELENLGSAFAMNLGLSVGAMGAARGLTALSGSRSALASYVGTRGVQALEWLKPYAAPLNNISSSAAKFGSLPGRAINIRNFVGTAGEFTKGLSMRFGLEFLEEGAEEVSGKAVTSLSKEFGLSDGTAQFLGSVTEFTFATANSIDGFSNGKLASLGVNAKNTGISIDQSGDYVFDGDAEALADNLYTQFEMRDGTDFELFTNEDGTIDLHILSEKDLGTSGFITLHTLQAKQEAQAENLRQKNYNKRSQMAKALKNFLSLPDIDIQNMSSKELRNAVKQGADLTRGQSKLVDTMLSRFRGNQLLATTVENLDNSSRQEFANQVLREEAGRKGDISLKFEGKVDVEVGTGDVASHISLTLDFEDFCRLTWSENGRVYDELSEEQKAQVREDYKNRQAVNLNFRGGQVTAVNREAFADLSTEEQSEILAHEANHYIASTFEFRKSYDNYEHKALKASTKGDYEAMIENIFILQSLEMEHELKAHFTESAYRDNPRKLEARLSADYEGKLTQLKAFIDGLKSENLISEMQHTELMTQYIETYFQYKQNLRSAIDAGTEILTFENGYEKLNITPMQEWAGLLHDIQLEERIEPAKVQEAALNNNFDLAEESSVSSLDFDERLVQKAASVRSNLEVSRMPGTPSRSTKKRNYENVYRHDRDVNVVADLHGNYEGYRANFESLGVIDEQGNWIGGDQELVLLGDIVADRNMTGLKILEELGKLKAQAQEQGGDLHILVGNHDDWMLSYMMMIDVADGYNPTYASFIGHLQGIGLTELLKYLPENVENPLGKVDFTFAEKSFGEDYDFGFFVRKGYNSPEDAEYSGAMTALYEHQKEVVENFRNTKEGMAMLETMASMKIVEHVDDTLFLHVNPTPKALSLVLELGVDNINSIYQRVVRYSLLGPENAAKPSAADYKLFATIRDAFMRSGVRANAQFKTDDEYNSVPLPTALREIGINHIMHGHDDVKAAKTQTLKDKNGEEVGITHLDVSAFKAGSSKKRSIGKVKKDGEIIAFADSTVMRGGKEVVAEPEDLTDFAVEIAPQYDGQVVEAVAYYEENVGPVESVEVVEEDATPEGPQKMESLLPYPFDVNDGNVIIELPGENRFELMKSPCQDALIIAYNGKQVKTLQPGDDNFEIGREGRDLNLNDLRISREHISIEYYDDGQLILTDPGSKNGTIVNQISKTVIVEPKRRPVLPPGGIPAVEKAAPKPAKPKSPDVFSVFKRTLGSVFGSKANRIAPSKLDTIEDQNGRRYDLKDIQTVGN